VRLLEIQRLAWMTASLSGFAKVEPFEKCFPKVVKSKPKASSSALFAYFDGVKAERDAKKA
jgi:hypothetical protein